MPKRDIRTLRKLAEIAGMGRQIFEEFGEERIKEVKNRLCSRCSIKFCWFMPITTTGEDCPYFKRMEDKR